MSPKQKKIAGKAPPPNKIDEKDFAVLRAEKAKGRGMGLQDESVKPGKVMKAKQGKMMKPKGYNHGGGIEIDTDIMGKRFDKKFAKHALSKDSQFHAKDYDAGIDIGEKRAMNEVMQESGLKFSEKPKVKAPVKAPVKRKPRPIDTENRDRRNKRNRRVVYKRNMGGIMKPMGYTKGGGMDTGRVGEMKSRITVAVDRLKKAKKFMGRGKMPGGLKKNMGGMMMQKPMGYSKGSKKPMGYMSGGMMKPMGYKHGTSVTASCKLGRNKPTKIT